MKLPIILLLLFMVGRVFSRKYEGIVKVFKRSMLEADPCLDKNEVERPSSIHFESRFGDVSRPWVREDGVQPKIYKSNGIDYQWAWMKSLLVKGMKQRTSIDDILQFLYKQKCIFIPVGPMIRDLIWKSQPVWLSGEVSCDLIDLYEDCVEKYGNTACALYPLPGDDYRLEIGDASANSTIDEVKAEPISIYNWGRFTQKELRNLSYTVDVMGLFDDGAGSTILIDTTGRGYTDTCEKKLVPTVDEKKDWQEWAENENMKLLRYFELRADGFSVPNVEFRNFLNKDVKEKIDRNTAQTFYCEHVLKGVINLSDGTSVCHTVFPGYEESRRITTMRAIMIDELGGGWNETIGHAADELEAVYLTSRQFSEVRSRVKKRVGEVDELRSKEEKILEDGKPIASNIADVHKRPIYSMSEEPVKLPVEFPSLPNAQPDGKGSFVEKSIEELEPLVFEESREGSGNEAIVFVNKNKKATILKADDISLRELEEATIASSEVEGIKDYDALELEQYDNASQFYGLMLPFIILVFIVL